MAIMIPHKLKEISPASREDDVFRALQKLPDDYYIFHSVSLLTVFRDYEYHGKSIREERQTDFVVLHPQKGIICIEAKNWLNITYNNGLDGRAEGWYKNGQLYQGNLRYDGPFEQVSSFCRDFRERLNANSNDLVRRAIYKTKVLPAVWLIPTHETEIRTMPLPLDVDRSCVLSFEDLQDVTRLEGKFQRIFDTQICSTDRNGNHTIIDHFAPLENDEATALISAIAPKFTISFAQYARETNEIVFNQLIQQQYAILNFLQDQKTAVISGVAGTGKTMLATKKAEIHAADGEQVLYLCFNKELAAALRNNFSHANVKYTTIDDYCCEICQHGFNPDRKDDFYAECIQILQNTDPGNYKYKHVILDEGQDICINYLIEEILEILKAIVELKDGTFYIFYDKMQLMPYTCRGTRSGKFPQIIVDADCKLTLYRNCRNTQKIAKSATVTKTPKPPAMMDGAPDGDNPLVYYCQDNLSIKEKIESTIAGLIRDGYARKDMVVLSLKGDNTKMNIGNTNGEINGVHYTTINMYKGLEAKIVFIVDFDQHVFDNDDTCVLYYVAASRAREKLYILTTMNDADAASINTNLFKWNIRNNDNPNTKVRPIRDTRSFEMAIGIRRPSTDQ